VVKKVVSSKKGGLMAFAKKKNTCVGCKSVMSQDGAVCSHCLARESQIYQKEVSIYHVLKFICNVLYLGKKAVTALVCHVIYSIFSVAFLCSHR